MVKRRLSLANSKTSFSEVTMVIHELDILLNDTHAPARKGAKGSKYWKEAKADERRAVAWIKGDNLTDPYSREKRKDVVLAIYQHCLLSAGLPKRNPVFWRKLGKNEMPTPDMVLGKIGGTNTLYRRVSNDDSEIIANLGSFRLTRAGGRIIKKDQTEPSTFALDAVSSAVCSGTFMHPSMLTHDAHMKLDTDDVKSSVDFESSMVDEDRPPRSSFEDCKFSGTRSITTANPQKNLRSSTKSLLSTRRDAPLKPLIGMEGNPSPASLSRPGAKRFTPSKNINEQKGGMFLPRSDTLPLQVSAQITREYIPQKRSSFLTIQPAVLQKIAMAKELESLRSRWDLCPIVHDKTTTFDFAKQAKQVILEEEEQISAVEAAKRVMVEHPPASSDDQESEAGSFLLDALDDTSLKSITIGRESSILTLELNRNSSVCSTMESGRSLNDLDTSARSWTTELSESLRDIVESTGDSSLINRNVSHRESPDSKGEGSFGEWLKNDFCSKGSDDSLIQRWLDRHSRRFITL